MFRLGSCQLVWPGLELQCMNRKNESINESILLLNRTIRFLCRLCSVMDDREKGEQVSHFQLTQLIDLEWNDMYND